MTKRYPILVACLLVVSIVFSAKAQSGSDYDTAFIGIPLEDLVMQRNKETYVIYGCAYCHGMDLKPVGEATDLRKSVIVGTDVNANLIGPLLRAGIPQTPKSSPMPQFSDLSDEEIRAIASYIHYSRARENFKELINETVAPGDLAEGKDFFQKSCAGCHSPQKDLKAIGKKYDINALREQILDPAQFRIPVSSGPANPKMSEGRVRHQFLLENYKKADVENVVAYLRSLK